MQGIFINHTNHPSSNWSKTQYKAAQAYGVLQDMLFPEIDADWDREYVEKLADETAALIKARHPSAVLCQGEFTYTYAMVRLLQQAGILVLAACSRRVVQEYVDAQGNTCKTSVFKFVRFREY